MENGIFVGGKVDKETAENLGEFVSTVFKSGKENGMDQSTIVAALGLVSKVITPEGTTISNCCFTSGKE